MNRDQRKWTARDAVTTVLVSVGLAGVVAAPHALNNLQQTHHHDSDQALSTVLRPAGALARGIGAESAMDGAERLLGRDKLTTSKG
jgi:hypothetical protein